jgi:hypothetical protein
VNSSTTEIPYVEDDTYQIEEMKGKHTYLDSGIRKINNTNRNNTNTRYQIRDDSNIEVFYASGDWHNVIS